MASKNFTGYLRDPLGEYATFDKWTFTHITTTGETVAGCTSILNIGDDGFYDIDIEYGQVNIRTKDTLNKNTINQGTYVINSETLVTTLPALLNAEVPVSDPVILEMEALLADAENAADRAESAAESPVIRFDTLTDAINETNTGLVYEGAALNLAGRNSKGDGGGAIWDVYTEGTFPVGEGIYDVYNHNTLPLQVRLRIVGLMELSVFGGLPDNSSDNTPILVSAATRTNAVILDGKLGVYRFNSDPEGLPDDFSTIVKGRFAFSGAFASKIKPTVSGGEEGALQGYPFSPELRNNGIEIVAGTIKQNPDDRTQWLFIKDPNHEPIGVVDSSPATASGSVITVPFDKTYTKVISLVCGPDESFSNGLAMSCGASVGLSEIQIKASINQTLAVEIYWSGTDWVVLPGSGQGGSGDFNVEITSVDYSNGTVTLNHDTLKGKDISLTGWTKNGAALPFIPVIRRVIDTQTTINFIDPVTGTFYLSSTPSTQMSFILRKSYNSGILLDGSLGSDSLDLDKGNIWFYGIFQV